jgi:hypothetical protein
MAQVRKSRVEALLEQALGLSEAELEELRRRLAAIPREGPSPGREPPHTILELKGLGKDFWRSIDVDAYLAEERRSWRS